MDIAAYIPCYDGGNAVTVVHKDGMTEIINKSIKTLIAGLFRESNMDLRYVKQNLAKTMGRKYHAPLPLGIDVVLVPVKVRKTIGQNDGAFAYVNMSFVKSVTGGRNAVISLTCGMNISCSETAKTVKSRIRLGELIQEKFESSIMKESSLKEGISLLNTEYSRNATRGDIMLLAAEILKLRNAMQK